MALFGFDEYISYRFIPAVAEDILAIPPVAAVPAQTLAATEALIGAGNVVLVSGALTDTIDLRSPFPADRHLEHRIRIEVESQMPVQNTVIWNSNNVQQLSTVIGSFPIKRDMHTRVVLNNAGIATSQITYDVPLLNGNIVFRESNNLVTQKYLLQSAQQFHNIRIELFMVRKEWKTNLNQFVARRRKMVFGVNQNFSAKLRFESV